ncbi:MAG: GTPase [Patescibacteria group bacterium]|nr:GTPase ObgE [Candidatus Saccharibacteria bacterium]MDQ5963708.1 GTPase [Patescibacteria group bacterium]
MNFIDNSSVTVVAGKGGNGRTSFRHEKFVDRGGPDGGDGGDGGSVIFVASRNQDTLMSFRYQKELRAENGQDGDKKKKHGRRGKNLLIPVPVGTMVYENEAIIADLTRDGQEYVIAKGGRGGFGNAHFISSVRQAPNFSEPGEEGELRELQLELKLIADVGLVGLPNAGKSTLISVVSNAKPAIADYPFTTLTPNLGVVDITGSGSMLLADIPGLIEGAADGRGLGDEFLKHVERTAVLLHLVDVRSGTVAEDYTVIQNELKNYAVDLSQKPQIVVIAKIDTVLPEDVEAAAKKLRKVVPKGVDILQISSQAHQNTQELMYKTHALVKQEREKQMKITEEESASKDELPVLTIPSETSWKVEKEKNGYRVSGPGIDRFSTRTDFSNEESLQRLRSIMRKKGILHELNRQGASPEDTITLKSGSFEL